MCSNYYTMKPFFYSCPILIILFLSFLSCVKKEEKPFQVTYEVILLTDIPVKTFISYTDSSGYVESAVDGRKWSKEVTLRPSQIASLLVTVSYDYLDEGFGDYYFKHYWMFENKRRQLICGRIVHPAKVVEEYSSSTILISLLKSETEESGDYFRRLLFSSANPPCPFSSGI